MMKMLLTVALLGSVGSSLADLAMAQGRQGTAYGSDASSSLAKVEAQCAHRRIMPPDPRVDCVRKRRSDAHLGYGQADGSANDSQASGIGPGSAGGQGNGIGPGRGGGQAKGRR
jgi:hypothetical protein